MKTMSEPFGMVLTYVGKGDGGYLTPSDSRRSDALYIAAKDNQEEDYKVLNKGKPILYVKWEQGVGTAPHAQMGSPSLFRKPDGTYGLVSSENNKGNAIYLWDSGDLLSFANQRRIPVTTEGPAVENPEILYDEAAGCYKLYWTSDNGAAAYMSVSSDGLQSFGPAAKRQESGRRPLSGPLPANAVPEEASEFPVTREELRTLRQKYAPVVHTGTEPLEDISIHKGEPLPPLPERIKLAYSDGSAKSLLIKWLADDIQAVRTSEPGQYRIKGEIMQSVFDYPFIPERADPFITFNPDDGHYYATGSYFPESDHATWTEREMGEIDYDRVTLRRAHTIAGLKTAEEHSVWIPKGEDGFVPCLWAPELHKINGTWSILVGAGQASGGRRWCSTMVLVEYTGTPQDLSSGDMLNPAAWRPRALEASPCAFDMTFAEINGTGYYLWPHANHLYIQRVDPADAAKRLGQPVRIKSIEWPFEYGKHNLEMTDQGIVEGAAVLQYGGKIYLSYAGATVDKYYCTAVLTADATADLMDPGSWSHPAFAALSTEDVVNTPGIVPHCGPGHNAFAIDEAGNPINIYHARPVPDPHTGQGAGGLHDPCRHMMVRPVHIAYDGTLILNMTAEEELSPEMREVVLTVTVIC